MTIFCVSIDLILHCYFTSCNRLVLEMLLVTNLTIFLTRKTNLDKCKHIFLHNIGDDTWWMSNYLRCQNFRKSFMLCNIGDDTWRMSNCFRCQQFLVLFIRCDYNRVCYQLIMRYIIWTCIGMNTEVNLYLLILRLRVHDNFPQR